MNVETGEIREFVSPDALQQALHTGSWIELDKMPDQKCKKCYGTGSLGRKVSTGMVGGVTTKSMRYVPCRCVKKKTEIDKALDRIRESK